MEIIMTDRIKFLKEETLCARNKCKRAPLPSYSVAECEGSIPVRKALGLKYMFDNMPLFIGEGEIIVGTRTFFTPHATNKDGHSVFDYTLNAYPTYLSENDLLPFGEMKTVYNKKHYTPDLSLLLDGGIGGIISAAEKRKEDQTLREHNRDFLESVIISYTGLKNLITRYSDYAFSLAENARGEEQERLTEIGRICKRISTEPPTSFREAVQLLWFGHLGTIIESGQFICYGRLDVILEKYIADTPDEVAREILAAFLLKTYDQVDINDLTYIQKHEGQLVVTLGGVLPNGENAVGRTTMLFLDAIEELMLPEPEFNLRISSKNPPEFLDRAAALSVRGANFISYYNDDLFVKSLTEAGLSPEDARSYGFDLCQDINVPGKCDTWIACEVVLAFELMNMLEECTDFSDFDSLFSAYKERVKRAIENSAQKFNRAHAHLNLYGDGKEAEFFSMRSELGKTGRSPLCPLPYLSGLFHGSIENAKDMIYDPYPIKKKGAYAGMPVEAVNSLAALKEVAFDKKKHTVEEIYLACKRNFGGEGDCEMRKMLRDAPKWGNDDPYVDSIAKELFEFTLRTLAAQSTPEGGNMLAGIHQPHPVANGQRLMATPDGRGSGEPVAVTLTPASGTMKNGATAALKSAACIDPSLVHWNYCVMVNYYRTVFSSPDGKDKFKNLLLGYFALGGLQHQPNILDKDELIKAQENPEKYKDLIVRLWGISAHFTDLPKNLQDEVIARLS